MHPVQLVPSLLITIVIDLNRLNSSFAKKSDFVMVGLSSPWGGSNSSRPDGWRLTALVFGHLSALDRMTFIVVQYLQYSATCFDQISDLLQALDN